MAYNPFDYRFAQRRPCPPAAKANTAGRAGKGAK